MATQLTIGDLRDRLAAWAGPAGATLHLLFDGKVLGVTAVHSAALHATTSPRPLEAGQVAAILELHDTGQRLMSTAAPAATPPAAVAEETPPSASPAPQPARPTPWLFGALCALGGIVVAVLCMTALDSPASHPNSPPPAPTASNN